MKKRIVSMAALALMMAVTMSACSENNPYPGYQKNKNGLYYQFYTQNESEMPQKGDVLEIGLGCMVNDSARFPFRNDLLKLQDPLFAGDLFEGLAMMHKGDSASFIVNIDSTFKYMFGQPTLPEEFKSTDVMRFNVKLNDFYPEKVLAQRFANDVKNRNAERAAKLQNDYPEQTAKAAKELADYLKKNNIIVEPTESGLYYVVTEAGNGEKPEAGKPVTLHYTGKLLNGTVFDSSVGGEPISLPIGVGHFIPGWDEGVQMMSKGEKAVLYVPYYLGYGERDMGEIPPFSNLIFEVELLDFETFE